MSAPKGATMSKAKKTTVTPEPAVAAAEAPAADGAQAQAQAVAAQASEAAQGPALDRLLALLRRRLAGTRVERLAQRLGQARGELPARLERELDALLDRAGLVRKSRVQTSPVVPEPKAA
jgi:anti-sigma factor ChrR (cupin superfamily)